MVSIKSLGALRSLKKCSGIVAILWKQLFSDSDRRDFYRPANDPGTANNPRTRNDYIWCLINHIETLLTLLTYVRISEIMKHLSLINLTENRLSFTIRSPKIILDNNDNIRSMLMYSVFCDDCLTESDQRKKKRLNKTDKGIRLRTHWTKTDLVVRPRSIKNKTRRFKIHLSFCSNLQASAQPFCLNKVKYYCLLSM